MNTHNPTILQQQEAIRRSGKTNMFAMNTVQRTASDHDFHELVVFIEDADGGAYLDMAQEAADQFRGEDLDVEVPA